MKPLSSDRSINIAVIAMGGQGGGVLSKWVTDLAEANGYLAQYTSVPGVAQRTGATVYYIEIFPAQLARMAGKAPVLALTPAPGNVDIVIASEMMEAGRAVVRGFVSKKTTLIASSHRDFAIVEKQLMGDGRRPSDPVISAARAAAGSFICHDMEAAARASGSIISSVLFGALAGSGVLPFDRQAFEKTIRQSKKSVDTNLKGFEAGFTLAQGGAPTLALRPQEPQGSLHPASAVSRLLERLHNEFPVMAKPMILEGLKRLVDYQGVAYAHSYLDQLEDIAHLDQRHGGERSGWRLTTEMARYLALAMSYEDTFRVADLKTRRQRTERCRSDVKAAPGQVITISEFMHPRYQEFCELLPYAVGRRFLHSPALQRVFAPFFRNGRRISTTKLRGFLVLYCLARLRGLRLFSLRHKLESERIAAWMSEIRITAPVNYGLACELAGLQRLIKGYGDTHHRGAANAAAIMKALPSFKHAVRADKALAALKSAALEDEEGIALGRALSVHLTAAGD